MERGQSLGMPIGGPSASDVARILLLMNIVAITFSPALVNLIELLLIITVAFSKALRSEIVAVCKSYLPAKLLVLFVGWIILAMTWGEAPLDDRIQELLSWRKLLLFPLILALVSDDFKTRMLYVIAIAGVGFALASWSVGLKDGSYSPTVLMRSDVVQTIYLALSFLALLSIVGTRFERIHLAGWLAVALLCVFLVVTILSLTGRSGYLFMLVGVCCFAWLWAGRYRVVAVLGLPLILGVIFVLMPKTGTEIRQGVTEVLDVLDPMQNPEFSSMGVRIVMWENTIDMILKKPLFGSGAGSFEVDYKKVAESKATGWRAGRSSDPHQQFLHVAAEYGLVGLLFLGTFLLSLIYRIHLDYWSVFGLSVLLGLCATSFFNGHLSSLVEGRIFWMLAPLFLYQSRRNSGLLDGRQR